jgi:hypothetical protein
MYIGKGSEATSATLSSSTSADLRTQYLLTAWSRVLEKLTVPQLVKKFPAFYGTQRFITHLSLPSVR